MPLVGRVPGAGQSTSDWTERSWQANGGACRSTSISTISCISADPKSAMPGRLRTGRKGAPYRMKSVEGPGVRAPRLAQCRVASPADLVLCEKKTQRSIHMKRIVFVAAVVAACGGSSNIAADRNRAGSGSSTLLVTATATVTASDTSPSTAYLVNVKNGQNAGVTGATVSFGAVSLTDA